MTFDIILEGDSAGNSRRMSRSDNNPTRLVSDLLKDLGRNRPLISIVRCSGGNASVSFCVHQLTSPNPSNPKTSCYLTQSRTQDRKGRAQVEKSTQYIFGHWLSTPDKFSLDWLRHPHKVAANVVFVVSGKAWDVSCLILFPHRGFHCPRPRCGQLTWRDVRWEEGQGKHRAGIRRSIHRSIDRR